MVMIMLFLKFCKQNTCGDWGYVVFAFLLFLGEPNWTRGRFICCCHLRAYVLSLLAALTCFLFSLASSCHANTTNRFHIRFFPCCIPLRLVSSVVSSRSSFTCKAYWENAASCLVLLGTCGAFIFVLFCPVLCAVVLFHFSFRYCQKAVLVRMFCLFYMPIFKFFDDSSLYPSLPSHGSIVSFV